MYKHALTSASSVYDLTATTAVQPLVLSGGVNAPTGDTRTGDQIVSVDVVSSGTGAAGAIALILVDPNETTDKKVRVETAVVTVTAVRSASAGASGGYICTVAFASTGSNKVDLNGHGYKPRAVSGAGVVAGEKAAATQWYIGCSDLGGLTSLTVCVTPARAI